MEELRVDMRERTPEEQALSNGDVTVTISMKEKRFMFGMFLSSISQSGVRKGDVLEVKRNNQ